MIKNKESQQSFVRPIFHLKLSHVSSGIELQIHEVSTFLCSIQHLFSIYAFCLMLWNFTTNALWKYRLRVQRPLGFQLPPSMSVCCWLFWRCPQLPGILRGGPVSMQGEQSWTHCCTRVWLLHTSPPHNIYRPPGGGEGEKLADRHAVTGQC